jgi:photosystem II CP47 chlorophyll apoprotein
LFISLWHISARPGILIYNLFVVNIIEAVLASSIITALFITIITSASIWYSSITTPLELFGPSRYQWDNSYFLLDIERRIKTQGYIKLNLLWKIIPDKLVLYDYIGGNPAKGGLFRAGPILKGDGLIQIEVHLNLN